MRAKFLEKNGKLTMLVHAEDTPVCCLNNLTRMVSASSSEIIVTQEYYAETGVGCTIIEAKSIEVARTKVLREVGTMAGIQVIRKATKADLAWVYSMQGKI